MRLLIDINVALDVILERAGQRSREPPHRSRCHAIGRCTASRRLPRRAGQQRFRPSVVDGLDTLPLEPLEGLPHGLELLRRVPLPVHDLSRYAQRLRGAVGPGRVTWIPLVGQVGIVLDRSGRFHYVDSADPFPERQFRAPGGGIQGAGQVNEGRRPIPFSEVC
jgi:hypothetical protein